MHNGIVSPPGLRRQPDNDYEDAATSTTNIAKHLILFRLGFASDLLTFSVLVVLISAIYIVLRPVNRNLALIAVFWRLVETGIMISVALHSSAVLELLNGSYRSAFGVEQRAQHLVALVSEPYR